MNYIPGFSNYLQSSVPRYAKGGPARFAGEDIYDGGYEAEPYQYTPTIQPVTQEAAAPYDMGGLGSLDFSGLYGGYDIGQYTPPAQPMAQAAATPYVEPYQPLPAVQPMTQEAAPAEALYQPLPAAQPMTQEVAPAEAPYDLSSLAGLDLSGLGGLNFSGFGGGRMGGVLQNDPNQEYITAPISNKGNPTGRMGGNVFTVTPEQPVRLVDHRTNQVVFEGTGYDAARKATELGQGLTDQFGRKANYSIQTADPTGAYNTVAYEKKNKSTLGTIANIAGTALPLAAMFIPGLNVLGTIAAGAGLGGAGAAIKGDNILKGAALGGLSAAGGQILGPALEAGGKLGTALAPRLATAVGTGIGSTVGGVATGQNLQNALIGGVLSGGLSYASPNISKALGVGAPASTGTSTSGGGYDGINVIGGRTISPSFTLGGSPNKIQQALAQGSEAPFDGITAIGNRLGGLSAVNFGGNQFGTPGQDQSAFDRLTEAADPNEILVRATPAAQTSSVSLSPDVRAGMAEFEKNPIISEGSKIERPTSVGFMPTDLGVLDRVSGMENYKEPIVVEGSKRVLPEPTSVSVMPPAGPVAEVLPPMKADPALTDGKKLGVEEYLRIAGLLSGLIGGGGSGRTSRYGGAGGTGRLNPIFSAKLPSAGGLGTIGMNRTQRPMGDVDWLTYGTRPELSFFDYSPRTASPTPVTTPGAPTRRVIGQGSRFVGDRLVPYNIYDDGTSDAPVEPITTPVQNNPAGPSMYVPDDMRFAEGGMFAAKGGGSPRRTEFAVNGPGTGRSDDIPAVLSDGEYVIDAETVALLGDGSSKAGAKKLDELRVKVRKHKGQKLAKGRFSANAKKPEAYLSGGRV